jgi:hypothetical protein
VPDDIPLAPGGDADWPTNYFNYFTEVEEHFRKARGTGLFLLSPVDWALIEAWKNGGIPLEAVLRGIDAAFEKWRKRPGRFRMVNALAYCTQAVMEEAEVMAAVPAGSAGGAGQRESETPFTLEEVRGWLEKNARKVRALPNPDYGEIAAALDDLLAESEELYANLESMERRLTALEEKMVAIARAATPDDELVAAREQLDAELRPYRGKMTAAQLSMLEKQYLDRRLMEATGLPRLSLFYLT